MYPTSLLVSRNDAVSPILKSVPPGLRLQALASYEGHLLIGTDKGIYTVRGSSLQLLPLGSEGREYSVLEMLPTKRSGVWITTSRSLIHLSHGQLAGLLTETEPSSALPDILDLLSDLPEPLTGGQGAAIEGSDGVLWFASQNHVVKVDPSDLRHNPLPPTMAISHLTLGRTVLAPLEPFSVPPGGGELHFEYTALSLSAAEKIRFRYRLQGIENDWVDVGSRRDAIFVGLSPGTYRFQVIACNNDGVWNYEGVSVPFRVLPRFYQATWFKVVIGVLALLLLWLFLVLRTRQISEAHRARTEARESERQHIARELHDNFFPALYGLFLSVGAVGKSLLGSGEAQARLDAVLDEADEVMDHGRDLILQLRDEPPLDTDFIDILTEFGRKQEAIHAIAFLAKVIGTRQSVDAKVQKQVIAIGREALWNAFRHSKAHEITLQIEFEERSAIMRVRDDGVGISSNVVKFGREGHLGLQSMRDRAKAIGADLIRARQRKGNNDLARVQAVAFGLRRLYFSLRTKCFHFPKRMSHSSVR